MKIVVNGVEKETGSRELAYTDVCSLAGKTDDPTVTFRRVDGRSGEMVRGNTIMVTDGLVFNVQHTGAAE
jgi:hypothetical protein